MPGLIHGMRGSSKTKKYSVETLQTKSGAWGMPQPTSRMGYVPQPIRETSLLIQHCPACHSSNSIHDIAILPACIAIGITDNMVSGNHCVVASSTLAAVIMIMLS